MTKRRFTSWLPLYFGEKNPYEVTTQVFNEDLEKYEKHTVIIDPYARFIKLLKKSLSFLTKGDTRKELSLDMVIEVLPKLIITHLVEML